MLTTIVDVQFLNIEWAETITDQEITRRILNLVEIDPAVSQKKLAAEIGISVGMINWHLKRCAKKGLVKFQQVPIHRYLYYLTPEGFNEKARLTASYLQSGFNIFREGREQYLGIFNKCELEGWQHIALVGDTELTELALMVSDRFNSNKIVCIIETDISRKDRYSIPIVLPSKILSKKKSRTKIQALIACHFLPNTDESIVTDCFLENLSLDRSRFLIPEFLK